MKSKRSFINAGILRNDIKSMGWIGATYLLGLLLAVPLQILMIHSRQQPSMISMVDTMHNPYLRIMQFASPLQLMLLVVVPVLTGLILFRYLQSNKTVDMIHALPIKRETLYNTHLTAGIIFLLIPVIITALVTGAVISGLGIEGVSNKAILIWLGVSLIINLLLFITSVATGMFSGMSSVQGVLTYILLFLPAGLSVLLLHNLHLYVYGLPYDYYTMKVNALSPLIRITEMSHRPFTGSEIIIYILCSLILYVVGRYLYQRRQLETATNAITFDSLRPIFKYGVTFCSMLVLGSYFNQVQHSMGWTYFGYILGSLLGYWLSEILISKSLNVFKLKATQGYLVFVLVMIILISGLNYNVTGYEKRLPELSQVESVYWDNNGSFRYLNNKKPQNYYSADYYDDYSRIVTMIYTNPENIAHIYEFNQAIIANRVQEKVEMRAAKSDNRRQDFCFAYKLKNGKMVYRQYNIAVNSYIDQLKPIYESQERKEMVNDILSVSPQNVDVVEIHANETSRSVRITDPLLVKEAITVIQNDVKGDTYENMISNRPCWAQINVLLNNDKRMHLEWNKSYIELENWLKSIGEYDNARVIPEMDIEYAVIQKTPVFSEDSRVKYEAKETKQLLLELEKKGDYLKITDPEQIETCLRTYTHKDEQTYRIIFVLKNGGSFDGFLDGNNAPEVVKNYFK